MYLGKMDMRKNIIGLVTDQPQQLFISKKEK